MPDPHLLDYGRALQSPAEDLDVEFKRTLPLADNVGKAKLAKEICALANHGGGYLVLGRDDDGSYPDAAPPEIANVDHDTVNQITSAYLEPAPHCSVSIQQPEGVAFEVVVIWVPSCGTAPVCAKKNGPNDARGRPEGINKGIHYIRKAGPVSAPIESPAEWHDVIRRCVLNDKTALLGALSTMIEQPRAPAEVRDGFDIEFEHLVSSWRAEAAEHPYDVDLTRNFEAYGFQLLGAEPVTTERISRSLDAVPRSTRGHGFFRSRYPEAHGPFLLEVEGIAGLEVHANTPDWDHRFLWRLSENLIGTEAISYWEDTEYIKRAVEERSSRKWNRGQHIWINQQIAYADNFLAMVKHMVNYFEYNGDVRLRVLFSGLSGRALKSPDAVVSYSREYLARQDTKQTDFVVNAAELAAETRSSIVVSMVQPMNKFTQGPEITPKGVVHSLRTI
ncbi:MAG: ATP-binding protein [Pseudomonadota bacterium]